jgi:coiled-coil domain-containing protein 40
MLKQSKLNYADVNKKEVEIEDLTNEVARVKIDNLNTKQQNDLLNTKVNELNTERNLKEIEVTEQERMAKKA